MDPDAIRRVEIPPAVAPARPRGTPVAIPPAGGSGFRDALRDAAGAARTPAPLAFSAHAQQRLASRGIRLSDDDLARMNAMADKAAAKGAQSSLFLVRDVAMIVSIKNRVVVTAVDGESMRDNVFTNIDSAAIVS